jgi:hypothetical protein
MKNLHYLCQTKNCLDILGETTYFLIFFLKYAHILIQCKFNYNFLSTSNFDKVYLFKTLILVFDQEGGTLTHDNSYFVNV